VEHPKDIGDRTTLAVMAALRSAGFALLVPFGENTRYDLVIDDGVSLGRVQCKTGRLRKGAVRFKACSSYAHHRRTEGSRTRPYSGEVDFFAIHCPETDGVYLVPLDDLPVKHQGALRVEKPLNAQRKHIRFAEKYEIGTVAVRRPKPG
jgi:PD-(D/E)XK endonuclease